MIFRKSIPDLITDTDLLNKYKSTDDLKYLSDLFSRYSHLVYGVCLKYLKDREAGKDAVLDIFDHLTTKVHRFEIVNFKSWLLTLTKNHCLMALRKKKRESNIFVPEEFNEESFVENENLEHLMSKKIKNNMLDNLMDSIEKLEKNQCTCIKMFYLDNKSYKEIYKITGFSLMQVKSYIQNGKRNLKNILSAEGEKVDLV
jgi:RNA polymerase sigma factor (sigma-70 family)